MSRSILSSMVDEMVDRFAGLVADKYDIPKKDIIDLLQVDEKKPTKPTKLTTKIVLDKVVDKLEETISEYSEEDLVRANKKELSAWCRMKGYKVSGTRAELMTRLLGKEPVKTTVSRKKAVKKKGPTKDQAQNLVDRLVKKKNPPLNLRRNNFGNYEHPETGLIFDTDNHLVIGKQTDDEYGVVTPLTPDDIDVCNQHNFSYRLPENLGHGRETLDNVNVEGIDDEEELELEEEEEEELEEVYEYVEE